jgi:hypothetical protein
LLRLTTLSDIHKLDRSPADEGSGRRRDLYLTTHKTKNRQTSMPPVGFEPAIPASQGPQNHALDRAATGIGFSYRNFRSLLDSSAFTSPSQCAIYCR